MRASRCFNTVMRPSPGAANASASPRNRSAGSSTGPAAGISASSATRAKRSATREPFLMSGIDSLLERFDPEALDRIDEQLIRSQAQGQIGLNDIFDEIGDLGVRHRRTDQGTEGGILVRLAADRDLVEFLAVL